MFLQKKYHMYIHNHAQIIRHFNVYRNSLKQKVSNMRGIKLMENFQHTCYSLGHINLNVK